MIDELPQQHSEKPINFLYFSSLYFVAVGILYLWGYWSTFSINILEYINLTDIAKLTAYPIASTFVFFALGVVASEFMGVARTFPSGEGKSILPSGTLRKYRIIIILTFTLGTLVLLIFGPIEKWFVLPGLFAIPITVYLAASHFLTSKISAERIRSIFLYLIAALPFYAYGYGVLAAHDIINGKQFDYLLSPIDNLPVPLSTEPGEKIRLIGHAGDFLFLWEPKNSIVAITRFEEYKTLLLKRFKKEKADSPSKTNATTKN